MYLERGGASSCAALPSACPSGWSQADLADVLDVGSNCRRTCYRTDRACLVMKLERSDQLGNPNPCGNIALVPPACPSGWSSADLGQVDKFGTNCTRTCFICP